MPFKSQKQERWAHTKTGIAKLGKKTVNEFDKASEGIELPKHKDPKPEPFNPVLKSNWGGRK